MQTAFTQIYYMIYIRDMVKAATNQNGDTPRRWYQNGNES